MRRRYFIAVVGNAAIEWRLAAPRHGRHGRWKLSYCIEQLVVDNGKSFQSGIRCEHFRNLDSTSNKQAKRTKVIDRSDRVKFKETRMRSRCINS